MTKSSPSRNSDFIVVGAGFFGAVIAERIANDLRRSVRVIESRNHIGGNCFSCLDETTGIEYHPYGTHVFHTSNPQVWKYLNQFTTLNTYRHQVLTTHKNRVYQLPINLETINAYYGLNLKPFEVDAFLSGEIRKAGITNPRNLEEKAISLVGVPLYEAFIKGYTWKHWQKDPKELPPGIITRLPVRKNYQEDYFYDCHVQGIPSDGYTAIFNKLLDSPLIRVELETDFFSVRHAISANYLTIYTGPIDRYFDYSAGTLEWRSIRLEKSHHAVGDWQGTAVMNYADVEVPYTRIHEPRHLHPERPYPPASTVTFKEYSCLDPEKPYYPIRTADNINVLRQYRDLARRESAILFGGRLGDYAYYDMDKVIAAALHEYHHSVRPLVLR